MPRQNTTIWENEPTEEQLKQLLEVLNYAGN